jgi:fructose-6-phosphate aldolase 2
MKIYLDSSDTEKIKEYVEALNLSGVTSNPSILKKDKSTVSKFIEAVPKGYTLFVQAVARDYEGILEDAHKIVSMREGTVVKVPVTKDGLKAIAKLHKEGIKTLGTAIYSAEQAILAANCGAEYVAPYVNRMCDLEMDGVQIALDIQNAFRNGNINCEVVAASFKNLFQIKTLLVNGIDAVTIPVDLLEKILTHQSTISAVDQFEKDWLSLSGEIHI